MGSKNRIAKHILQTILKDSNYNLSLFSDEEIEALRQKVFTKEARGKETPFINCIVRDKEIQLKPEEVVRQLYATRLIVECAKRAVEIAIEKDEKSANDWLEA